MQHDVERERLARSIENDHADLRRALRSLALSAVLGLNLPRRIRERPIPWALGAVGVAAFVILRRQKRKRLQRRSHWWERGGAQA
jgi:hypothetical protein